MGRAQREGKTGHVRLALLSGAGVNRWVRLLLGLLGLALAVGGGAGVLALRDAFARQDDVLEADVASLLASQRLVIAGEQAGRHARNYLVTGDARFLQARQQALASLGTEMAALRAHTSEPRKRQLLEQVAQAETVLVQVTDAQLASGRRLELSEVVRQIATQREALDLRIAEFVEAQQRDFSLHRQQVGRVTARTLWLLVGITLLALGLCVLTGLVLVQEARRRRGAEEFQQRLADIIGHDIRSPLAAITASAEHLLRTDGFTEAQRNTVARIVRSSVRIHRLLILLIDFTHSRLGGVLPVRREPTDLQRLCRKVQGRFELLHPERIKVVVVGNVEGAFDVARIEQALVSLVDNALQYGSPEAPVTVSCRGGKSEVELEVHNDGPAIPPELLSSLFRPFAKKEPSEDTVRVSVGLGLYLVKQIVEAHGGQVWVHSRAQEGTTFTLVFPRYPRKEDAHAPGRLRMAEG